MSQTVLNLIATCCFAILGCASESERPPSFSLSSPAPRDWDMSPADAVLAAMRFASANEIPLSEYGEPRVSSDVFEGDRFWAVLYDGKSRIPGDHFMLLINDTTKAIEYIPGE